MVSRLAGWLAGLPAAIATRSPRQPWLLSSPWLSLLACQLLISQQGRMTEGWPCLWQVQAGPTCASSAKFHCPCRQSDGKVCPFQERCLPVCPTAATNRKIVFPDCADNWLASTVAELLSWLSNCVLARRQMRQKTRDKGQETRDKFFQKATLYFVQSWPAALNEHRHCRIVSCDS